MEFVENNKLDSPNDTVYSLLGVINKMQIVADRTILLGEIRGDLTTLTENANLDLQALANFEGLENSPYNQISDYYAIIQNCNYYIENVNLDLVKHGQKVFEREYAVIKTYRAWAYLQLALNYGSVPFVTKPILTEKDAELSKYPKYDVQAIANYFIEDLAPYIDTKYPEYGTFSDVNSRYYYIPVRVLLGDLCLWAGRYDEACKYYHDFLTKTGDTHPTNMYRAAWIDNKFETFSDSYSGSFTSTTESFCCIPMEIEEYDGVVTRLPDVFNSTEDNNYFYQATHSKAYDALSRSQRSVLVYTDPTTQLPDTLVNPFDYNNPLAKGDLRMASIYQMRNRVASTSLESDIMMSNQKFTMVSVRLYRLQHVYLRFAEALNRAGYPNAAFAVLKYGLCKDYIEKYIPETERQAAGDVLSFSEYIFTRENTQGLHSRGSGDAYADVEYAIPECATKADSILAVENLICDEMALETSCEGLRYYDLMRLSMHRGDPTFLANKVANRDGKVNSNLLSKLSNQTNWYLPIK